MKKIYTTFFCALFLSMVVIPSFAQRQAGKVLDNTIKFNPVTGSSYAKPNADCDTVNFPIPDSWTGTTYIVGSGGVNGYVNGTNFYGDKQKANAFDLSETVHTYVTGTYVAFGKANSKTAANLDKTIKFHVYDEVGGKPANILATKEMTMAEVKADVATGEFTYVAFDEPVAMPASQKFYVSVDISNFSWSTDSIWIAGTLDGEAGANTAWEQWDTNTWYAYSSGDAWGLDVTLWIFPTVSVGPESCLALPVKLLSFNAEKKAKDVNLTWKVAEEINMDRYEIERADNNNTFRTIATVKATNSLIEHAYSSLDLDAFSKSSTVMYRLKQVNKDGSYEYSRVITVKGNSIIANAVFENPFFNALKVQLTLTESKPVSFFLYDTHGKLVHSEKRQTLSQGENVVNMPSTTSLKSGLYMLKIVAGNDQVMYKVIKK